MKYRVDHDTFIWRDKNSFSRCFWEKLLSIVALFSGVSLIFGIIEIKSILLKKDRKPY